MALILISAIGALVYLYIRSNKQVKIESLTGKIRLY
jgi:hypothetical protein